jgi:DNA-binding transcriptional MerR regulator
MSALSSVKSPLKSPDALMTIGTLAKACGVTVRALRYYEELQLICATQRSEGGYRLYDASTTKRIAAIVTLQDLNYSLDDILEILGVAEQSNTLPLKAQRIERSRQLLERQHQCLSEKLISLTALQADLAKRLAVLETQCTPCETHNPDAGACRSCEHQDTHWH